MKLLQINDNEWINPEMITHIEEDLYEPKGCYITLTGDNHYRWTDMSAKELMSKICEEVYYGDDGICKEDK